MEKEIKVGQALKNNIPSLNPINKPYKIYPIYLDETNRIIDRDLIIHSHETFSNEKKNIYSKGYMNTLYNLLFRNNKQYYREREHLTFDSFPNKKINKKSNEFNNNFVSLNSDTYKINAKSFNGQSMIEKFIKKRKRKIMSCENILKHIKLLNNDNFRVIQTLNLTDRKEKDYQNSLKFNIDKRLFCYSNRLNKLKIVDFQNQHNSKRHLKFNKSNVFKKPNLNKFLYQRK